MIEVFQLQGLVVLLIEIDELGDDTSKAAAEIQAAFDTEKAKSTGVVVVAPGAVWPHLAVRGLILPDEIVDIASVLFARLEELAAAGYRVVITALPRSSGLDAIRDRLNRPAGSA